ncbi:MAG: glycosyltransferase family 2 protein [Rhodobacteraceae bacterium]|nr:glycosyltransferase family 2 protein [Paracoccaceae bacterium]
MPADTTPAQTRPAKAARKRPSAAQPAPEVTIVVPTFNERENIRPLTDLVEAALPGVAWELAFVDDDSPDGTAEEVRALALEDPRVRLIHRVGRRGLAGACIEGILSSISPLVAVMDADLQHDESKLAEMLAAFRADDTLDLVIGSRHAEGGSAGEGFSRLRAWGSEGATRLAKRLLRIEASDPMSGFFMVRRTSFNQVVLELQTQGFKILADMLSASRGKWKVAEVAYEFRARQHGQSKMDTAVALEFLGLLGARMTGGMVPIRFIMFVMVGFTGVFVQLAVVRFMLVFIPDHFAIAQSFGVLVAMTTNFMLNNALTYRDRTLRGGAFWRGLLSFYAVCLVGAVANVGVAESVYRILPLWALASFVGAVVGALWNFVVSALVTWRAR